MNGEMFLKLVIEMREMQKKWYDTHKYEYLGKAKKLEKQVDEMIDIYYQDLDKLRPNQLIFNFVE